MVSIDDARVEAERQKLVRQCYRLTGNLDAAEDLAQETLYEGIRNAHKLHDPSGYGPWLFAIARNVCRRWNAAQIGSPRHLPEDWDAADIDDLEVELDRTELVTLLDRALALLPEETRTVLIERYVRESPHAEIAQKLGLSEYAVTKRVERGRLYLRRILSTTLIHDAASHGLAEQLLSDWTTTEIWCPVCGIRHLVGHITAGTLWLVCKPCGALPVSVHATLPVPSGARGCRAIHAAACERQYRTFAAGIDGRAVPCERCGHDLQLQVATDPSDGTHYARGSCRRCAFSAWQFVSSYQLLASPGGQEFWQHEERIRMLPERPIDIGVPGLVVGFESMTSGHQVEAILVRDTLELIAVV